ncbi:MAG: hypothetical protein V7788_11400 [Alphaproteobacteria bacterium]|mgnify:FL=1|jgi:DNA-binding ferritin-like protein
MNEHYESDVGEHALGEVQAFLSKAQSLPTASVKDIAEQLRVQEMLAKSTRRRKKVFEALADYFEHAHEVRDKAENTKHEGEGIGGAVRALLDNFDDD